jgi:N-acetylated-alpha-linked acidic dipeptidase
MNRILPVLLALPALCGEAPIRGYPPAQWPERHKLEERARSFADPERVRQYVQRMTAEPHHAGSPGSRAVAEYALGLLRQWGYDARIETFEALLPYPLRRELELVAPVKYKPVLREPRIAEDPDSGDAGQLPVYNAYSASGTVAAPVVYVNYGLPEDYEQLARLGIDVKGKIVLARYGKSWRGTKPKVAFEHGAAGCLIYSDPRDDGYYHGDVYPKGPFRPPKGAQRGSVMDMPLYVGDPLSPGWASERGSRRLSPGEARVMMKIPVLPISYEDAQPLLEHLEGPVAPEAWRGALPLTYHIGPGPATVRLTVELDSETRPVHNVIAMLRGSDFPDQWVIYGNHHDAWVNGAQDPASGAAALLETARAVAELARQGWKPKRTLVFALWDAEEFGLVGSTEWVEKHLEELQRKAVVYLNTDSNERGVVSASGSHSLEEFIREVYRDVRDPDTGQSVLDRARETKKPDGAAGGVFKLGAAGAGSDYVAFLHHAGIASLYLGFDAGTPQGVYHSIFDSFAWYSRFGDPGFQYGKALAQVMATSVLRLGDAPVLPFEFDALARTVSGYLDELRKLAQSKNARLDWAELEQELATLKVAGQEFETAFAAAVERSPDASKDSLARLNEALSRTERALTLAKGLPGREWYRHQLYAPGQYTGYSAKTLPGIREPLEAAQAEDAERGAKAAAEALRGLKKQIAEATELLRSI